MEKEGGGSTRKMPASYRRVLRRYQVRLPKLNEKEWTVLLAASDDWENAETIEDQISRTLSISQEDPSYQDWRAAWPTGVKREEILSLLEQLHSRGLLDAVMEDRSGRWQTKFDRAAFRVEPERFWFLVKEDLRNALGEMAAGQMPLRQLTELGGQSVSVLEVLLNTYD